MHQLKGLETMWLALDGSNQPMHFAGLRIYNPSTAPGGKVTFNDIIEFIESKLDEIPVYRRKLLKPQMSLDHPFWIDDENFDLNNHIKNIALPAPGNLKQLFKLTGQIHSQPLDLFHPPWEWWVIEGLDNVKGLPKGSYAILNKSHHSLIDGGSDFEIEDILHSHFPELSNKVSPTEWSPKKKPNRLELFAVGAVNNIMKPFMLANDMLNIGKGLGKAVCERKLMLPTRAPRTRFNRPVSRNLVFGVHTVKLDEIKSIRKTVDGVTVTDVAMAIISGAMRRYLNDKGELPDKSLITINPVSVRRKEEKGTYGNQLGVMRVLLRSDIADPIERLRALGDASVKAKEMTDAIGLRGLADFANHLPGSAVILPVWIAKMTKTFNPDFYNTTISSLPGSQKPLYMNGAQLADTYGSGFLYDGLGLFHGVNSYNGKINFNVTSCRDIMPDLEFYIQCIRDSFDELKAAASGQESRIAEKSSKGKSSNGTKESSKDNTSV